MKKQIAGILALAMLGGALSGCGNKAQVTNEDPNTVPETVYEINWYMQGMPQPDVASVEAAVNEYLKDKINATLKITRLESSQYTKQLSTMIAAGEYFDLAWASQGVLDYTSNARNGAWYDMTDTINTYMPKTAAEIGEDILNNAKVDGKLYAIPTLKEMADSRGWTYRSDIAEKYDIDMSKFTSLQSDEDVEKLEEALRKVQAGEPDMQYPIDWGSDRTPENFLKYETVAGTAVIFYDTEKYPQYEGKVVNLTETPEYLNACKAAHKLYADGFVKKDVDTATDFDQRVKDGRTFCYLDFLKPGKAKESSANYGVPLDQTEPVTGVWQDNGAGTGSMQVISRTSKNPARVMRFLELLNTDPVLNNLINYGIEGKHYDKIDENTIKIKEGTNYTLQGYQWMTGNVFLNYLTENEDPNKVENLKSFNKEAKKPMDYGFQFNKTSVESEIAAVRTVMSEYRKQVIMGNIDPEKKMAEYTNKLKAAGIDKIVSEAQKQYDEFLKNKE